MELKEIIKKLVGDITPIGETNQDDIRFENLKVLCNLVDDLVCEIDEVSFKFRHRNEFSMKRAGEYAGNFLTKTLRIV